MSSCSPPPPPPPSLRSPLPLWRPRVARTSLPIEDIFSRSSDPYCVVRVGSPGGGYKTAKTPTVTKSLSPKWMWQVSTARARGRHERCSHTLAACAPTLARFTPQHRFVFPLAAPPTELCISVWDMDIGAQDDPLGSVDLDLSASLRGARCAARGVDTCCLCTCDLTCTASRTRVSCARCMAAAGEAALTDDPDGWTALQHASTGQIRVHLKVERRGTQPDLPWPKHQPWLELLRDHQLPCTDPALKVRVRRSVLRAPPRG